jgi:hypothetical protein
MAMLVKLCLLMCTAAVAEGSSCVPGSDEIEGGEDQAVLLQKNIDVSGLADPCDECKDLHDGCADWAAKGECDKNAHWMWPNCPVSCNRCPHCDDGTCKDLDPNCPLWAEQGQCDNNPTWMWPNCAVSCDRCPHANEGKCVDKDPNCQWWSSQGECDSNPGWMWESCPVSCDKCPHITANPTTAAPITAAPATAAPTTAPPATAAPTTAAPTPAPAPVIPKGFGEVGEGYCVDENGKQLPNLSADDVEVNSCGNLCKDRSDCLAYSHYAEAGKTRCALWVATDQQHKTWTINGVKFTGYAGTSSTKKHVTKAGGQKNWQCYAKTCELGCKACGYNWYENQWNNGSPSSYFTNKDCGCCMGNKGGNSKTSAEYQVCQGVCAPGSLDPNAKKDDRRRRRRRYWC